MAETSISVSQDQFRCPVCLDLLKDPVAIPCGHSYCMRCISDCWDQDDQKRVYSCPQCRQTFTPRPALFKNTMLAEVVEKLKTKQQAAVHDHSYAGPGDVECDVCTGRKHKAIKSCLVCLESYCQNHFDRHEEFHSGKRHKVTDATGRLQEMICPQHGKMLEIYCRTDQQCVCYLCIDEHKNHETVSSSAERTEKQSQLKESQRKYQQRIQKRQKELEELRAVVESHKRSAQTAVEDCEMMLTELISSIERSRSEVTQLIRDQETAAVSRAEGLLEQLKQEIDDLKRRDAELEQLSHTDHHIHFLQSFQSLSVPPGSTDSPSITVRSLPSFDDVVKSVSHLREKLEHFCKAEVEKISDRVKGTEIIPSPEPKTREQFLQLKGTEIIPSPEPKTREQFLQLKGTEIIPSPEPKTREQFLQLKHTEIIPSPEPKTREQFLQYSHQLTLDLNTLNKHLRLSEGNREITNTKTVQCYPDHPDRFEYCEQVLCRESVCGRSYWEIEWSGCVYISVSYKSISRKGGGNECRFGGNDQSWRWFCCTKSSYSFWHNNKRTKIPVVSRSRRIGVYVDHSAGSLSFYSVSDTMTLIHRVHTTFTQPLYPGCGLYWDNSKVKLCDLTM